MPFSIENELSSIAETENGQEDVFMIRGALDTLKHYFLANGYSANVRDDSRLAFLWANGDLPANIYDIAQEMATIQYISNSTDYHACTERALRRFADTIKAKHKRVSWKTVWEIVREHGPDIVKYTILQQHLASLRDAGGAFTLPEMNFNFVP